MKCCIQFCRLRMIPNYLKDFFEYSMSMQSVRLGESVGVKCRIQLCRLRIEPNQIYIFGGQLIVRQCSFSVSNIVQ